MVLAHRNAALWVTIRVEVLGGAVVPGCMERRSLGTETVMGEELRAGGLTAGPGRA